MSEHALVGIVMGSKSDYDVLLAAVEILKALEIPHEARVLSAHRTPDQLFEYVAKAEAQGTQVFIAGAGGAAHLGGVVAAITELPVIGVPIVSGSLQGQDSLLSLVQMPKGVPVATVAVNGARNAGLLAVRILATHDPALARAMASFQTDLAAQARDQDAHLSGGPAE